MSQEVYILKNQIHFGALKFSVSKGLKLFVDRENKKVIINGREYDNVSEVDLCIRSGFIIPFIEGETNVESVAKISQKAAEKRLIKMEVEKSDLDNMSRDIDISDTKKEVREANRKNAKLEVIRENEAEESRGLKVITNNKKETVLSADSNEKVMQIVNGDDGEVVAKIPVKSSRPKGVPESTTSTLSVSNDKETLDAINGSQGTVVKTIGKSKNSKEVTTGNKLTAKRASKSSADKAKANAEARKKASEARRAKAAKE